MDENYNGMIEETSDKHIYDSEIPSESIPVSDVELQNETAESEEDMPGQVFFKSVRAKAVKILSRFERSDSYLDKLMEHELEDSDLSFLDKSLLTELVNGVIRWRGKLDWVLTGFYFGDYQKNLNIVKNAMRVALYQIQFLDKIPLYASVNEAVELVKRLQGEKTAGMVNGVLRNIARNLEGVRYPVKEEDVVYYYSVIYSHPRWMVKRWLDRFGESETEKLLQRNNLRPHVPVRVNLMNYSPRDFLFYLRENNIYHYHSQFSDNSFNIKVPGRSIFSLELFQEGKLTVQDTSATLATKLAAPMSGQTILDLCAAPGGKSFYLAELMNDKGRVIAIDKYPSKLNFIKSGAERLGLKCIETIAGDSEEISLEVQPDIVFADVPCSGLGTLSKKPDIKWKREREDITQLAEIQQRILENASKYIKPGGVIVYSTCTIEPEENEDIIMVFLKNHSDFELDPAEKYLPASVCEDGFMKTLPHIHKIDGAFAARLVRRKD
jgi:16S rRNA (cytosine967-C5)-methyltransferase